MDRALKTLSERRAFVAICRRVDCRDFAVPALDGLVQRLDCGVLKADSDFDEETETGTTRLSVVMDDWDSGREESARAAIQRLFDESALATCGTCRLLYPVRDPRDCVVYLHSGEREEVEPGRMEVAGGDGEAPIVVRFSCCGRVARDGAGCVRRDVGDHVPERGFSDLEFSVESIHSE